MKDQRFVLLYNSINKLALDPEDPYDTQNYQIFVWYELNPERLLFNVSKVFNKKGAYSAKLNYPLPEDTTIQQFMNDVREFASSKISLMYVEQGQLRFKIGKIIVLGSYFNIFFFS